MEKSINFRQLLFGGLFVLLGFINYLEYSTISSYIADIVKNIADVQMRPIANFLFVVGIPVIGIGLLAASGLPYLIGIHLGISLLSRFISIPPRKLQTGLKIARIFPWIIVGILIMLAIKPISAGAYFYAVSTYLTVAFGISFFQVLFVAKLDIPEEVDTTTGFIEKPSVTLLSTINKVIYIEYENSGIFQKVPENQRSAILTEGQRGWVLDRRKEYCYTADVSTKEGGTTLDIKLTIKIHPQFLPDTSTLKQLECVNNLIANQGTRVRQEVKSTIHASLYQFTKLTNWVMALYVPASHIRDQHLMRLGGYLQQFLTNLNNEYRYLKSELSQNINRSLLRETGYSSDTSLFQVHEIVFNQLSDAELTLDQFKENVRKFNKHNQEAFVTIQEKEAEWYYKLLLASLSKIGSGTFSADELKKAIFGSKEHYTTSEHQHGNAQVENEQPPYEKLERPSDEEVAELILTELKEIEVSESDLNNQQVFETRLVDVLKRNDPIINYFALQKKSLEAFVGKLTKDVSIFDITWLEVKDRINKYLTV